jgi:hypothetical protein
VYFKLNFKYYQFVFVFLRINSENLQKNQTLMKKITKEERDKMMWRGRGGSSLVFRTMAGMNVGDIYLIEPDDWKRKYPPTSIVRYIEKKYGRKYYTLRSVEGKGWSVERLK